MAQEVAMTEEVAVLASRWKRLGGSVIDSLVMAAITIPISLATGAFQRALSGQAMTFGEQAVLSGIGWVAFVAVNGYLLFKKGQTVGKVVVKTKIVDLDGKVPNFGILLVFRYIVFGAMGLTPVIGGLIAFVQILLIFGKQRRCGHDYLAGTRVVNA